MSIIHLNSSQVKVSSLSAKMNLLSVKNISKEFVSANQRTFAIDKIGFEVKEREFISVIGPSGCGKTTLLMMLSGLMPPTSGEIILKGSAVDTPPPVLFFSSKIIVVLYCLGVKFLKMSVSV